jgi:hypothetical protein
MTHQEKLEAIRQKCLEEMPCTKHPKAVECTCDLPSRPIRLADVLLAMNIGEFTTTDEIEKESSEVHTLVLLWNLREDDLTKQSPETIDFLTDLLTPKGEPSKEN